MKNQAIFYTLLAGVLLGFQSCGPKEEETKKEEISDPRVNVSFVQDTSFTHRIRIQGNVETDEDVMLTAEMGGLITSINVKEGQKVSKGAIIATVDASVLASNKVELVTQLDYAKYMLDKQVELTKRGVGSEFELETAKNQVKSLQTKIASLSTQQGKAVIRAPFTGVIDEVFATKGQMAGPQSPIVRLVNNSSIDIIASISEKHFSSVHEGTEMTVTFPNYSDTAILLKVTNVGNYIEPLNRTFRIKSTIENNTFFLPNMLAEINITDLHVDNGTVIPSEAILKDQDNNDYVYIINKEKGKSVAKKKVIQVIEHYEGKTLIKDGVLKAGEQVVVKGARGITENTIVTIKETH